MIAVGFRITVAKWLVLVRLLLGEIPERLEFTVPGLTKALQPYFRLTLAVRSGDLSTFRWGSSTKGQTMGLHPAQIPLVNPLSDLLDLLSTSLPYCTGTLHVLLSIFPPAVTSACPPMLLVPSSQ